MRPFVEKQLKKVVFANLNNYDEKTGTFIIPKYTKPKYDLNRCYLIKLDQEIINNPNSVTAINWNNGKYPAHQYYKAYVSKTMGTMIYVDALAFDFNTKQDLTVMWSGWLNIENLTQIAVL